MAPVSGDLGNVFRTRPEEEGGRAGGRLGVAGQLGCVGVAGWTHLGLSAASGERGGFCCERAPGSTWTQGRASHFLQKRLPSCSFSLETND